MSEQFPLAALKDQPLAEVTDAYLSLQDPAFLADAREQIEANATPGLLDYPEPLIAVPKFIAAAEESPDQVVHTLRQYDQEVARGTQPFFSILSLNTSEQADGTSGRAARANVRDIKRAIEAVRPTLQLPFSYFEIDYPSGTTIGKIKKDPADVAIDTTARIFDGRAMPDLFGILFQDIDVVRLSPSHINKLWTQLTLGAAVVQGSVRHARSSGRHPAFPGFAGQFPEMDKVMFIFDLALAYGGFLQDYQNLFDLRKYMLTNGVSPNDAHGEVISVILRGEKEFGSEFTSIFEPHAFAAMSPRRPYWCMQDGIPPTEMWHKRPFSIVESYRQFDPATLHDISRGQADDMVAHTTKVDRDKNGQPAGLFVGMRQQLLNEAIDTTRAAMERDPKELSDNELRRQAVIAAKERYNRTVAVHRLVFAQGRNGGLPPGRNGFGEPPLRPRV